MYPALFLFFGLIASVKHSRGILPAHHVHRTSVPRIFHHNLINFPPASPSPFPSSYTFLASESHPYLSLASFSFHNPTNSSAKMHLILLLAAAPIPASILVSADLIIPPTLCDGIFSSDTCNSGWIAHQNYNCLCDWQIPPCDLWSCPKDPGARAVCFPAITRIRDLRVYCRWYVGVRRAGVCMGVHRRLGAIIFGIVEGGERGVR